MCFRRSFCSIEIWAINVNNLHTFIELVAHFGGLLDPVAFNKEFINTHKGMPPLLQ